MFLPVEKINVAHHPQLPIGENDAHLLDYEQMKREMDNEVIGSERFVKNVSKMVSEKGTTTDDNKNNISQRNVDQIVFSDGALDMYYHEGKNPPVLLNYHKNIKNEVNNHELPQRQIDLATSQDLAVVLIRNVEENEFKDENYEEEGDLIWDGEQKFEDEYYANKLEKD